MDDGVQGPRRPDPAQPARRAVPRGRPDAERARGALPDDALRRDEAPASCSRRRASSSPSGAGREKLHFLNPVPIRLVHDRWVSKYAEPWAAALSGLKTRTGGRPMEKVFEIYIRRRPERLWEAITDPEIREQVQLRGRRSTPTGRPAPRYEMGARRRRRSDRRGREPRGRPAAPARADASTRCGATT